MRRAALLLLAAGAWAQDAGRTIASESDVRTIVFEQDGSLSGLCADGKIRIWDAATGKLRKTISPSAGERILALNQGVAGTAGKTSLRLWDFDTAQGRDVAEAPARVRTMAVAKDRKLFAATGPSFERGSEETIRVWDAAGKQRFAAPAGIGGTSALAISPDGQIVVASSYDTDVRAYSTRNGELLKRIDQLPVAVFAMQFSPDGKYLATAGVDRAVYLWDTKTWQVAKKITGQAEMIRSLSFSPDGRYLLTGGFSELTTRHPVEIILWEVATGKMVRRMAAPNAVGSVAFSPDGGMMAAALGGKNLNVWRVPR
ncbi:MAG: WD40 repeat domain-containing protein [Bryobacterales bacterium]|nr:WD40 repeat domain-containing protein [Bryobacterales bacterium]